MDSKLFRDALFFFCVISIVTIMAIPGLLPAQEQEKRDGRPNILFIFTDDHAVQAIGAYGSRINKTPNIDRLASNGAIFLNSFCCNSICAPSRAAVLTGKHSHKNGHMNNLTEFDASQTTFPHLLQKAGYQTALIGKWHLKSTPQGFDHWEILPGQGNYYNPHFISEDGSTTYTGYCTDIVTDLSIEWLEKRDRIHARCRTVSPHNRISYRRVSRHPLISALKYRFPPRPWPSWPWDRFLLALCLPNMLRIDRLSAFWSRHRPSDSGRSCRCIKRVSLFFPPFAEGPFIYQS